MNKNVIEVRELNKSFGNVHAVKDLSFRVKRGELFAFLGVNGAGKSTVSAWACVPGQCIGQTVDCEGESEKQGSIIRYYRGSI